MAPTTVCPMVHTQSLEPIEMGSGRRRLSLDSWVCLPMLWPVRTSTSTSQVSSSGSSCATLKDLPHVKALSLDVGEEKAAAAAGTQLESGCETPKSKEHRIPDVDVGFCPPAPRKPRAMARRRRRVQPTSFFNSPDFENFISQHKVPVSS